MSYGAKETSHVSMPHSHPVRWSCTRKGTVKTVSVEATYWIDARKEAARQLVCEPDQVLCVLESESEPPPVANGHLNGKAQH